MSKRRVFSREFKMEAVKLVTEQGYGVSQAAESLGISANSLRKWRGKFEDQGQEAFPGKGKLTATEEELRKLREECRRLRMERDILKKVAPRKAWEKGTPSFGTDETSHRNPFRARACPAEPNRQPEASLAWWSGNRHYEA